MKKIYNLKNVIVNYKEMSKDKFNNLKNKIVSIYYNKDRDLNLKYFNPKKVDFYDFRTYKKFNQEMKDLFRIDKEHKSNENSKNNFFIILKTNDNNKLVFDYKEFGKDEFTRDAQKMEFFKNIREIGNKFDDVITLRLEFLENPKEFDKDIFYEIYDIVEYFNSKQEPEFPYYKPILGVMHNDIDTSKKRNNKVHLHLILCYDYKYLNSFRFNDKQKTLVYKEKYF